MNKILVVVMLALAMNKNTKAAQSYAVGSFYNNEEKSYSDPAGQIDTDFDLDRSYADDEYGYTKDMMEEDSQDLQEYDQHITDNVKPSKISQGEALLREMLGALLVRYILLKEKASDYFQDFKNVVTHWYHTFVG